MNWNERIKNKSFWLTLIPAIALVVQTVAVPFGYTIDLTEFTGQVLAIINAVFAVLAIIGVVTDPKTEGFKDKEK